MAKYSELLRNSRTGEKIIVSSNNEYTLEQKKERIYARWEKENTKADGISRAKEILDNAYNEQNEYINILKKTLAKDDRISWEELKDHKLFHDYTSQMKKEESSFFSHIGKASFLEKLIPFLRNRRQKKIDEAKIKWNQYQETYNKDEAVLLEKYQNQKKAYYDKQENHNKEVEMMKFKYESGDTSGIEKYIDLVLENSYYPSSINLDHNFVYNKEQLSLKISTKLPLLDDLNLVSDVKYIASKDELQIKQINKSESKKLHEEICRQICLRTIHEIFESEYLGHIQEVNFIGYIQGIDSRNGQDKKMSFVELVVERKQFESINLRSIESNACLHNLKAIFAKEIQHIIRDKVA